MHCLPWSLLIGKDFKEVPYEPFKEFHASFISSVTQFQWLKKQCLDRAVIFDALAKPCAQAVGCPLNIMQYALRSQCRPNKCQESLSLLQYANHTDHLQVVF